MLAGKKVLVTGAGGFIGSHLVEALVQRGANVTAMTQYNSASSIGNLRHLPSEIIDQVKITAGNIQDSDYVNLVAKNQNIIFHLAALIAIPYSYQAPRSYIRTNVEGTINILEAARHLGTERLIHTSTSEVYGTALREPIDENHPLQGQSPYSASKIGADKVAESYYKSFDLPVVTIRPFNTYGPRQSARAFIPTIIAQALTQESIRLGSLTPQRDMTFVSDTVNGFLCGAATSNIEGETINLGTGKTMSVGDFAESILKTMGISKPILYDSDRARPERSEVMKLISDNQKAARVMNWETNGGSGERHPTNR
uniref:GDP-mannose 4,6-dehydratase n=1 Tax=Methylobacterium sp. B34 TaxID=95563 RepID=UPI0003490C9D|nr:GDP-mannose 4,6-dehydratase [Methylobacterium sp. B34]